MPASDSKFGGFADGGDLAVNDIVVGLRNGVNTRFSFQGTPGLYLPLAGGTMSGGIDMDSNAITGVPVPSAGSDATNKTYVDSRTAAVGASGTILRSNGSNWVASTATYPNVGTSTGSFLYADGTNWVASTSLWPNTVGASGRFIISNGTNNVYSTSTIPTSAGATANKVLLSDGTNYVLSTPTFPNASATSGKLIISDGTNWIASTPTYPNSYVLGDVLYASNANVISALAGNITTAKQYLSQTGTGAVSAAPAWSTIAGSDITGDALTKVDDTNVTLTLGGTPATALLRAASLTLGWTGQLSLTRGGTAASLTASNGGIVYSTASAMAILSGTATANQVLLSGSSSAPAWSTATYPATTTINQLLYSSSNNTIVGLATANSAVLVTSAGGVPSLSTTLPNGLAMGTPASLTLTNATGLPISTGVSGLGSGVATGLASAVIGTGGVALATTGTFTPTVTGSSANPTSVTYATQLGHYTKMGNICFFSLHVTLSALTLGGAAGNLQISGLPFTSDTTASLNYGSAVIYANVTLSAGTVDLTAYINNNTTNIVFLESKSAGGNTAVAITSIANNTEIIISGFYFTV